MNFVNFEARLLLCKRIAACVIKGLNLENTKVFSVCTSTHPYFWLKSFTKGGNKLFLGNVPPPGERGDNFGKRTICFYKDFGRILKLKTRTFGNVGMLRHVKKTSLIT